MVPLPYANDIMSNQKMMEYGKIDQSSVGNMGIVDTLTKEETNSAKLLIKNLNIDFNSNNFENPTL